MARKKTSKKEYRKLIIFGIILVILIIVLLVILMFMKREEPVAQDIAQISANIEKKENDAILKKLYDMSEQERITYYCGEFFKLVDTKNYEKAYNLLYSEYKDNYFPSVSTFKKYIETYFPDDI